MIEKHATEHCWLKKVAAVEKMKNIIPNGEINADWGEVSSILLTTGNKSHLSKATNAFF
jgi:hypothetical protein